MDNEQLASISADQTKWTVIFVVVLLVAGALIGAGALALMTITQQAQLPTGSQSTPSH